MQVKIMLVKVAFILCLCLSLINPVFSNQNDWLLNNPLKTKTISNGLLLVYQKDKASAVTVFSLVIKGGKRAEPVGNDGLAYLTTRLSLEIPDRGKVQDIMSQATRISMNSKGDYSVITVSCLSENLEDVAELTSKIILDPLFSGIRIDNIKKMMNHLRKAEADNSPNAAYNAAIETFFKGMSYGKSVLGTEETLKAIKKKNIQDFYKKYFVAGNMVITVITDFDEELTFRILEKHFSPIPLGKAPTPEAITLSPLQENSLVLEKEAQQTLISRVFLLPKITPKSYILASLIKNLLGQGVNSRLWSSLRIKEKLAYNVNARATLMKGAGVLEAYLETDNGKRESAAEALKMVLVNLYEHGITEEELDITKTHYKSYFMRENETKENRARSLSSFEGLGFGLDFFTKFFQNVDNVTLEDINTFIKEYLKPDQGLEITIGPKVQ